LQSDSKGSHILKGRQYYPGFANIEVIIILPATIF
jgi:hypothetical protein